MKQIVNGRILTPQGWLTDGSVVVEGNKILSVLNSTLPIEGAERIDAKGGYVVPGGIEMHIHGGGGRVELLDESAELGRILASDATSWKARKKPSAWLSTHTCKTERPPSSRRSLLRRCP